MMKCVVGALLCILFSAQPSKAHEHWANSIFTRVCCCLALLKRTTPFCGQMCAFIQTEARYNASTPTHYRDTSAQKFHLGELVKSITPCA